ncbi:MAG: DNRLRE domain-containing protein [Anaerolineae bacterium]|nr:DNRLRE domain-containing protein [Anaerolineae bacterium]
MNRQNVISLIVLSMLVLSLPILASSDVPPQTRSAAVALAPLDTTTLYATADTYVDSATPTQNYGSVTTLYVGNQTPSAIDRALFRFDLSGLPSNAVIDNANFRAYMNVAPSTPPLSLDVGVYRITESWSETGVVWGNQPAVLSIGKITGVGMTVQYYEWEVTGLAQDWLASPATNFGLELRSEIEGTVAWRGFASREATAASRPQLVIEYHLPTCSDPQEPNDTFGEAFLISAGVEYLGCIPTPSDLDYFRFDVAPNTAISVELFNLPANYDLYLYDPAQVLLDSSANGGTTSEMVEYTTGLAGGQFYAKVQSSGEWDLYNPYALKLTLTPVPVWPDLVINDVWYEDGQVCYEIENIGSATALQGHSTSLHIDGLMVVTDSIDVDLAPGAAIQRCFAYQWQCTLPQDTLTVCADYADDVSESNESNNCAIEIWPCEGIAPPALILLPARGGSGITAQMSGVRFPVSKTVDLYWDAVTSASKIGEATPDADGYFSLSVAIPSGATPGTHTVLAHRTSDPPLQVSTTFQIVASPILNITPLQGPRGSRVAVALSNLNPEGAITLYWDANILLGPLPLKGASTWEGIVLVPGITSDGSHTVKAVITVLGRVINRASAFFQVLPGPAPTPEPPPTPWLLNVQAPERIIVGQPLSVTGHAAPGEVVGIGILGTWRASAWDYVFRAMPVMTMTTANGEGVFSAQVDIGDVTTAGSSDSRVAVGAISPRGADFSDGMVVVPQADITGRVTYGPDDTPATYAVVRAFRDAFHETVARADGYYDLFLWPEGGSANITAPATDYNFPPFETIPERWLGDPRPLIDPLIAATHHEYNLFGDLIAYRWSDPLPLVIRPGDRLAIDIHLTHEITSGPVITEVTASIDGSPPGDNTFGTYLSLLTLPEGQRVAVENTFTAQVAPLPSDSEISWVRFTLGDETITDTHGANGWTAQFDMSALTPGNHTLTVIAANDYGVISEEPWQGTVVVWDSAKRTSFGWLDEWRIIWSAVEKKYTLRATVPSISPFWEEDLSLPLLGTLHNRLASDVDFTETFSISGTWTAQAVGELDATLLDVDVLEELGLEETTYTLTPNFYSRDDRRYHGRPNYYALYDRTWELITFEQTVYDGILWTYAGLISIGMRLDFGIDGRLTMSLNLEAEDGVPSGRLTPALGAHVNFDLYVDILLGLASAGIRATPQFMAEFPIVFLVTDPYCEIDNPCARFAVSGEAWVKIDLWFWEERWSWGPIDFVEASFPEGCSPAGWPPRTLTRQAPGIAPNRTQLWIRTTPSSSTQEDEHPVIFAAPAIATNDAGHAMAIWIEDQSVDPSQPNPEVVASLWDGYGWNSPQRITDNDRWETDPKVVFFAPDRALAVWTQNELPRDYTDDDLTLDTMLANQELYFSVWDGVTWSAAARLTDNAQPDGRVALSADMSRGRALAAWVHDEDGLLATKGDWEIYFAAWDGTDWSAPTPISPNPATELEVELAYDGAGQIWAVWIRDPDGDLNETAASDRHLVYAAWDGLTWTEPISQTGWPIGVLYPSIDFDTAGNPLIVFTVRGLLPSGDLGGAGHDYLYAAYYHNEEWEVTPVNTQIAAEHPRVAVDRQDRAVVLFRGFDRPNTQGYVGEMAVAVADLTQPTMTWGPVDFLTQDDVLDWQIAFDVDAMTGDLHAFGIKQGTSSASGYERMMTADTNGTLYSLNAMAAPDLTLREVTVSDAHPMSQTINISATVLNRGLAAVDGPFIVHFAHGDLEAGSSIGQVSVPGPLAPNLSTTVSVAWLAPSGVQTLTVSADAEGTIAESDEGNNTAAIEIGRPPAPRALVASRAPDSGRVLVVWQAPDTSGIVGYRIYRSAVAGGPYELIGLSLDTVFEDRISPRLEQTNYYVITAFDEMDVSSNYSQEALADPWEGHRVYLPVTLK